ncbi:MAG: hemerythrin domain-containing protein [Ignavibacteria bacterium]|nr:hemerythrin domain-containing protein [Ignavibacteria bacterium]
MNTAFSEIQRSGNYYSSVMSFHSDPIETLVKEHDDALKQLNILNNAAMSIKVNGFSAEAFEKIAKTIRYIGTEMRKHDEKEERFLLPLLEKHVSGPSSAMRNEHRELWAAFSQLLQLVHNAEEGKITGRSISDLVRSSIFIVELSTTHIAKENNVLFPMVKQVLSQEEYEQLKRDFATIEQ